MDAENDANTLIKALTIDFEKEYEEEKLPREVAVWLGILELPRKLIKSGDSRIDLIVSNLFDLACSMDEGFKAFVELNKEAEEVVKDKDRCTKKKEALEEKATKACETVQEQAHYQTTVQANAARAIQEFRGSQEESEASKWEWQVLIGAAARSLIRAGTEYSKAFAEVKRFEKKAAKLTEKLENIMAAREAKRLPVIELVDRWQSTISEIDIIIRTMYDVRESWPSDEKITEALSKLEAILHLKDEIHQEDVLVQSLAETHLDIPEAAPIQ